MQKAAKNFVRVFQYYDGLNGRVIKWSLEHGNTNHDPGILVWLLDPKGKVIDRPGGKLGSASALAGWLREMSRASFPLVDPASYKILRRQAVAVASMRKLGSTLRELRHLAQTDGEAREEAKRLLAKMLDYVSFQFERAASLKKSSPVEALSTYKEMARKFKGDEAGTKADEIYKALRKDKAFQKEVKGAAILDQMRELSRKIKPKRPLDSPANRKVVARLKGLLNGLRKAFKGTLALEQAEKLMQNLGH